MDGWMGQMVKMDGWMNEWMVDEWLKANSGWIGGWMNEGMGGWMNGWWIDE